MSKSNLRNVEGVSRTNAFNVDPSVIKIDWKSNPREDYGKDFEELKESIRENGVQEPLRVYIDKKDGSLNLAHGFRRMKAVTELLAEGHVVEKVNIISIENNEETILMSHIILNGGKPLNDIETSYTLWKLHNKMGENSMAEIAKRVGMPYLKVVNFINFYKESTAQTRELVKDNKLSMTNAIAIVKQSNGSKEQYKTIDNAIENMTKEGRKRISPKDLKGINLQNRVDKVNVITEVVTKLSNAKVKEVSVDSLKEMLLLLDTTSPTADDLVNLLSAKVQA